mmetsp:Transcript_40226/g.110601  ORF Transcript_40226/g.110601 Transcript_40226/m.110601 type:complete len:203 (-) Transcript_40226:737-1345(-)
MERFQPALRHEERGHGAALRHVPDLNTCAAPGDNRLEPRAERRLHRRESKDKREAVERKQGRDAPDHERHHRIESTSSFGGEREREPRDQKKDLHPVLPEAAKVTLELFPLLAHLDTLVQMGNAHVQHRQCSNAVERSQPNRPSAAMIARVRRGLLVDVDGVAKGMYFSSGAREQQQQHATFEKHEGDRCDDHDESQLRVLF